MSGEIEVDPERLRQLATAAADIERRLRALGSTASAAVSPGSSAWGGDEYGVNFEEGKKFPDHSAATILATTTVAKAFSDFAIGQRRTADVLDGTEQINTNSF